MCSFLELLKSPYENNKYEVISGLKTAGGIILAGALGYLTIKKIYNFKISRELEKLAELKRAERKGQINGLKCELGSSSSSMKESEIKAICCLPLKDLIEALQSRKLSALQVTSAYMAKAIQVHEMTNSISFFNPDALKMAEELDSLENVVGVLHGLPIAVKDSHDLMGLDTFRGFSRNFGKPAEGNEAVVQILVNLGAIPFCKTSIPQTLFTGGSHNPQFGMTLNPLNSNFPLSPGGSSSGAGALVAGGGALIATGSDIGGSLRIPAHFCGLATIKPTSTRISSKKGGKIIGPMPIGIPAVNGYICQSAEDMAAIFKILTQENRQNGADPLIAPIPWNELAFSSTRSLRIGYYEDISFFPSIGDTREVVGEAVEALQSLGHTLVPFDLPDANQYMKIAMDLLFTHYSNYFLDPFKNEKVSISIADIHKYMLMSTWRRKITAYLTQNLKFAPFYSKIRHLLILAGLDCASSKGLAEILAGKANLIQTLLTQMDEKNLDLLIGPSFPFPAIRAGDEAKLVLMIAYTIIWNVTDFPAGIVKFGVESGTKFCDYDDQGDQVLRWAKESVANSVGMPISVQIIGRPYQEETVLRGLVELEKFHKNKARNQQQQQN